MAKANKLCLLVALKLFVKPKKKKTNFIKKMKEERQTHQW